MWEFAYYTDNTYVSAPVKSPAKTDSLLVRRFRSGCVNRLCAGSGVPTSPAGEPAWYTPALREIA